MPAPEERHPAPLGKPPQRQPIGFGPGARRRAIEQHQCRAEQQAADVGVPYHPRGAGCPEDAIACADVAVNSLGQRSIGDDSCMAVHDGLRQPAGAGGVEDPQGMLGRDGPHLKRRASGRRVVPQQSLQSLGAARWRAGLIEQRHPHDAFERGQLREDSLERFAAVKGSSPKAVPVAGDPQSGGSDRRR